MGSADAQHAHEASGAAGRRPHSSPDFMARLNRSILRKTVALSFGIVVFVSIVFVSTTLPRQRTMLVRALETKAEMLATSIAEVTVTSMISGSYADVVMHCQAVLEARPALRYAIITPEIANEGRSLVHFPGGIWRSDALDGELWRPSPGTASEGRFIETVTGEPVLHYSYPLKYSNIDWGWVHIGLATDEYTQDLNALGAASGVVTILALLVGFCCSLLFGRTLSRPIRELDTVTQRVAAGDLSATVELHTGDELERLAASFNKMTVALNSSRDELLASLREKEVLLKEVHHRVKNNLQVISSLLSLQSGYVEDAKALSMFTESESRVRSMALVHEKLYQSDDLARVDFAEYAADLTRELFRSYHAPRGQVELEVNVEDVLLGVDVAIPCGLIINELVSNALKHAFPDGRSGTVWVSMVCSDDRAVLVVADDGVGMPEGMDIELTDSLGLQLVSTLSGQLNGELQVTVSGGTEFRLTFSPPMSLAAAPKQ